MYVIYRLVDPLPPRHLAIVAGIAGIDDLLKVGQFDCGGYRAVYGIPTEEGLSYGEDIPTASAGLIWRRNSHLGVKTVSPLKGDGHAARFAVASRASIISTTSFISQSRWVTPAAIAANVGGDEQFVRNV